MVSIALCFVGTYILNINVALDCSPTLFEYWRQAFAVCILLEMNAFSTPTLTTLYTYII